MGGIIAAVAGGGAALAGVAAAVYWVRSRRAKAARVGRAITSKTATATL